jgi:hypothetical protein
MKILTFVPVVIALVGLLRTPLFSKWLWLFYPITFASIVVLPLIEQRYYLVPVVLFLAFRHPTTSCWEVLQTGFYIVGSFWLFHGIVTHQFFL